MKLLNLGCGQRYHTEWTNIDFVSSNDHVVAHNLLQGIPRADNEFDVVYHSHVLEHFSKQDGKLFLEECYRVLKPGGIIRVAVPDLEQIVKNYLKSLEGALASDDASARNYEWMMLEMYDQVVRNHSGGDMADYLYRDEIRNEEFVYSRIGEEGRTIRERFLKSKNETQKDQPRSVPLLNRFFKPGTYVQKIKNIFLKKELSELKKQKHFIEIGQFRSGGEVHQWMYDRYSLEKILRETGFENIQVKTAFDSAIDNWKKYNLEEKDGIIFKPDSLFMEGQKPS